MVERILVWDVPTRVFHWSLALSFAGAYITSESERYRDIHVALGYILAALLVFRLIWGFAGTAYARFSSFSFKPSEVITYLKSLLGKSHAHYLGHNPAGSVAIYLLLALGIVTAISGVMLYWEIGGEDTFEELHEVAANGMLAVVLIHIAGVIVSSVLHKENLARSMLTGYKQGLADKAIQRNYLGLGIAMLLAIAVFLVLYLR